MYSLYIDHPNHLEAYDFLPGEKYGDDVVSRKLNVKARFICNSYAKISRGDIYEISFERPEDVTAFILKCEYELIANDKIEQYRISKR